VLFFAPAEACENGVLGETMSHEESPIQTIADSRNPPARRKSGSDAGTVKIGFGKYALPFETFLNVGSLIRAEVGALSRPWLVPASGTISETARQWPERHRMTLQDISRRRRGC
jgi:hypothetical protein